MGGIAMLAVLALVALAAAAGPTGEGGPDAPAELISVALAALLGVLVVTVLALVAVAFYALLPGLPRQPEASLTGVAVRTVVFCVFALLVVYLGAAVIQAAGLDRVLIIGPVPPDAASVVARRAGFPWLAGLLGALGAVGALAAVTWGRRGRRDDPVAAPVAAPLSELLQRLVVDLQAPTDARGRVIAAYAQMVELFTARGHPPAVSEAPGEYLARVLPALGVGDCAAQRLRALYELARFSPHPVGEDLRGAALSALDALREELVAA
jgi:Domain of unknown function (DUF4129)